MRCCFRSAALLAALASATPASADRLTIAATPGLDSLAAGQESEIVVDLEGNDELQQYVLGIELDASRLELVSATPLTSSAVPGGGFERDDFDLDPSASLAARTCSAWAPSRVSMRSSRTVLRAPVDPSPSWSTCTTLARSAAMTCETRASRPGTSSSSTRIRFRRP